jgi:hypothetical protein
MLYSNDYYNRYPEKAIEKNRKAREEYAKDPAKYMKQKRDYYIDKPALYAFHRNRHRSKANGWKAIADFMPFELFEIWYLARLPFKCEVCETTENVVIDHCHISGRPRGILCMGHNLAEGYMKNVETVKNLLRYMERYNDQD